MIPKTTFLDKFLFSEKRMRLNGFKIDDIVYDFSSDEEICEKDILDFFPNYDVSVNLQISKEKRYSNDKKYLYRIKFIMNRRYDFNEHLLFSGKIFLLLKKLNLKHSSWGGHA